MNIAELSLKRPVSTIMFFVSLMVIGTIAAFRLPLEFFPAVDAPFCFVNIPYVGSTPAEVERTITRPVEEALATISGVERLNSTSRADGAQIFMQFKWGHDVAIKASEVRSRIDAIRDDLPSDLQRYQVLKFSTGDEPVLKVRLSSNQDLAGAYDLIDRKLKRPIERLPGIARVDISGVAAPEVEIALKSDRISAHGIGLNDLAKRLQAANFSTSAGQINDSGQRFRVQPIGEFRDLESIKSLPVNEQGLKLGDIADVSLKPARLDIRRHLDLRPAVGIDIFKERNANLVDAARVALQEVNRVGALPEMQGIQLYVLQDQGKGVTESLKSLAEAGLIGSLLSLIVLYFFLRHWPSTLMVSLAVPVCFVMTLGMMYFAGLTLNVLSMMGLLLGVGMVVDNAVVAVESIYQQREKFPNDPPKASILGVRQVAIALSAGTLCHCIVFLPNIFGAKNFISIYLSHVAITISISLLASWLVAVSLVPLLSARIKAPDFVSKDSIVSRLKDRYARAVEWTLRHRAKTMLATALLLAVSFVPATKVKFDMFPAGQTRQLNLNYDLNGAYRLEDLERNIGRIERWLMDHKEEFEIRSVYSFMSEGFGAGTFILLYEDERAKKPASEIMEEIRKGLPKIAIGEATFNNQRRGGANGGLQLTLVGDSGATLRDLGKTLVPVISHVEGLRDVRIDEGSSNREVSVRVDRERAAQYGFSAQEVASFIGIALRGAPLKEFRGGDHEVPVWLRFQGSDTASVDALSDYKLRKPDGELIPLMALIEVKTSDTPSGIQRQNRQTALAIKINLADKVAADQARKDIEAALKPVSLPPGYRYSFDGGFNDSDEAGGQMLFNTVIALMMIYVVMAALFESIIFPAAILTSIVFSIFGVFWLFWLTGTTFSIMASIGILILMGVVVNNGIVMVEHINQLRHDGLSRTEALVRGARDRLRPIIMTMGCTILGMFPLCIGSTQIGGDGPPYYPMARAIVGGLIFSTIITLLVLPSIYAILDDWRLGARRLVRQARGLSPEGEDEGEAAPEAA